MKKKHKRVVAASMAMMLAATSAAAVPVMAKTTSDEVSEREARNAELSMNLATFWRTRTMLCRLLTAEILHCSAEVLTPLLKEEQDPVM